MARGACMRASVGSWSYTVLQKEQAQSLSPGGRSLQLAFLLDMASIHWIQIWERPSHKALCFSH